MYCSLRDNGYVLLRLSIAILASIGLLIHISFAVAPAERESEQVNEEEQLKQALVAFEAGDYEKTQAILQPLCVANNTDALTWLGFMHELGLGVDLDEKQGELYLRQATVRGNVAAARYMTWKLSKADKAFEENAAAARYRTLAEKNLAANPKVPTRIGWMTMVAEKFPENYDRALRWNIKNIETENSTVYYNMGVLHDMGRGVELSRKQAASWWDRAAKQNHPLAFWRLGLYYENGGLGKRNLKKAIAHYEKAAELGHMPAVHQLIAILESDEGFDAETEKALLWNRQAAIQGNAKAQSNLGYWYEAGTNIQQDFNQAIHWYSYAAEQKDTRALTLLGRAYILGRGVKINYEKGLKMLKEASDQGSPLAKYYLGYMYKNGLGVETDTNQAFAYYQEAADLGLAEAQFYLSENYFMGLAVDKDIDESLRLLNEAAEQGYHNAEMRLAHWYYKGIAVEQDDELFYYWVSRAAEHGSTVGNGLIRALDNSSDDLHTTVDDFWDRAKAYGNRKDYLKKQRQDYIRGSIKYKPPRPIDVTNPQLPTHLRDKITNGRVMLKLNVSKRGYVTSVEIEDSTHDELKEPTVKAVKKWLFAPSMRDGKPANGQVRLPIVYN